jgi:hypothetical protein
MRRVGDEPAPLLLAGKPGREGKIGDGLAPDERDLAPTRYLAA